MDADPPTQPGRRVVSNRKTGMQVVVSIAVVIVVLGAMARDVLAGTPEHPVAPILTADAIMVALGVLGVGAGGAQAGNVMEHIAKSIPDAVREFARGLAEALGRRGRGE